jgi:SAM-dependent methyltransferase
MMSRDGLPSIEDAQGEKEFALASSWADLLRCPECGKKLHQDSEELHCSVCNQVWPVVSGVPHFVKDFPYWGEIPLEHMREVNRLAAEGPWKAPLLYSSEPSVQRATEMILNLDRANWQLLLNLPLKSRVLDVGAGMGTTSHALALRYQEVIALEPVVERIQFMRQRFAQEKLKNIKILRSSLWVLPFATESMDLVAMNGVLEWVAEGQVGDPTELQERALRKVFKLLRPGGYLYLGIENRFSLGCFIGYPDPHCGLPFVTVLPRPLAQLYARRKGLNSYRNYLYSSRGYRKLLRKVGFNKLEFYLALPSYNHPRFLIPLDGEAFSYYCRNFNGLHGNGLRRIVHKILMRLKVLPYLESSFVILARK